MSLSSLWDRLCPPTATKLPQPKPDKSCNEEWDWGSLSEADSDCQPIQDMPSGPRVSGNGPSRSDHHASDSGQSGSEPGSPGSDESFSGPRQSESEDDCSESDDHSNHVSAVTESESESESESEVKRREARRKQTENARKAAQESKLLRKMTRQFAVLPHEQKSEYLPILRGDEGHEMTGPGQWQKHTQKRRRRLLYSWFRSACSFINTFFEQTPCQHVFSVSVIDDTNTSLSTQVSGQWQSSRTVTMLNNVQTCVACFEADDASGQRRMEHRSFPMHTPPTCLPRANAQSLLQELRSWLLFEPGSRWEKFGLRSSLLAKVPFVCHIMCFDSLSTNVRLLKMLRRMFFKRRQNQQRQPQQDQTDQAQPLIGLVCGIHQLALARKALLFYHSGIWSNIVRLSHLFATQNFRVQFRSAMFAVIAENFQHVTVQAFPRQHQDWKRERDRLCNLMDGDSEYRKLRRKFHRCLAKFDNGDPSSPLFTHWCVGLDCCRGDTQDERSNFAFMMMCKYCYFLFAMGYAVPLSYRWKHSQPALRFCQDTCSNWCGLHPQNFWMESDVFQKFTRLRLQIWFDMIWLIWYDMIWFNDSIMNYDRFRWYDSWYDLIWYGPWF